MADTDQHEVIAFDLFCPDCGYNLRGLTGEKCPECGASIADLRSASSNIPWAYRRKSDRVRAYWRTVWWASLRPRQFGAEIGRSVSYRDAQVFRWVTILHVQVPLLLATFLATVGDFSGWITDEDLLGLLRPPWPALVANLVVAVWLVVATGIPSYFFDYRDQPVFRRNNSVALSYYCCGPLALIPLAPAIVLLGTALVEASENLSILIILAGMLLPVAVLLCWWLNLHHAAQRLLPEHGPRRRLLQIGVPLLWVGTAVVIAALAALFALSGLTLLVLFE